MSATAAASSQGRRIPSKHLITLAMEPLKPLEPLPSLWPEKRKRRLLSWATAAAILCAIGVGVLHGVGGKIFNAVWELLRTG